MGLKIICVDNGNYLDRGREYVKILANMVARNLPIDTIYDFICFTDNPEPIDDGIKINKLPNLKSWWAKLYLFKEGLFSKDDRIIYLDLDTVITGDLKDIINYDGAFAILRDFYRPHGLQSSVMSWRGDWGGHIWREYERANFPDISGGDQAWIEQHVLRPDIWQELYPKQFVSYKVNATSSIPNNAKIVVFHGEPRPHQCLGWVKQFWKVGGSNTIDNVVGNTDEEKLTENILYSIKLDRQWVDKFEDEHDGHAVIIGGGPSLKHDLKEIFLRKNNGQHIFSLNNSWQWLVDKGLYPDAHIMLDARPENAKFVPTFPVKKYYASQCDKTVWDAAPDAFLWNHLNAMNLVEDDPRANTMIAGGSTVGLNAMALAYVLGYRKIHLYGFDSSYDEERHHAYDQDLNDKERVIVATAAGQEFTTAAWMADQVNQFCTLLPQLIELGCIVTVHGYGMLPHVAKHMNKAPTDEISNIAGIWWPSHDLECQGSIDKTVCDTDVILSYVKDKSICVQAGGNVGVWPKVFSQHFDLVYTFEPDEVNYKCLLLNCNENNIIKSNSALGAEQGSCGYNRINGNCGAGHVSQDTTHKMSTIDGLNLLSCGLIQLDIEGYELNALKGARKTIFNHSPVIVVEDKGLSEKYGVKKGEITEYLSNFGYSIAKTINRDIIFTKGN